ncbi:hypothetical protein FC62_GL000832 [Amylolactobacillus amylotrophicus DSM 20534]|uniref:Nucleotidyltransferase n=3 Tax=Amylolactobacillus TaxID=2767876 RepID=A0A1L6XBH2_9LACO|nr:MULTISPECIES: Y-family DNA polymerase [Amylolactobacillus]APT18282.1 nucleotidyltransferase [Amylolactobacillus amylophilus DSM 20533 = JCM 1125]KRK38062.1 hypothetical protein FC62_GL000832 [Amylolactobacillus amylotrophicus DSM 20534]KRM42322.1 hypothetical protein FD40_GL001109 [Amylolactobacillus amylophilus DSM 20533 = JCM 1125]GED80124.1 type VI secretion protein ImpB [Amylolactobacillus amylophilus]
MYDYRYEPKRLIFMIDNKSFYASVESVALGLNPLKTKLVVMSTQKNTNGGLVLAASPMAKKKYGIKNVMRQRNLPTKEEAPDLIYVEPHMNLYIQKSMEIIEIFRKYVADEDLHVYSIDESILDMTNSYQLFGKDPFEVARKIQLDIRNQLGIYTTVGIGENPLLAKFALDIDAKKRATMIAFWHYVEVADTIWQISDLTDVWGINKRTAAHLERIGIHNMYELAHTDPVKLKNEFGIIGEQLFAMSWGVDRSLIRDKYIPQARSYGNSQVLPRDYLVQREIEIVIREIGEQVAARIRSRKLQTGLVSLWIGFSYKSSTGKKRSGFRKQQKISYTNDNKELVEELLALFRSNWHGEIVRNIGVDYGDLIPEQVSQLNLFVQPQQLEKRSKLDRTADQIRKKFGLKSAVKLSSLAPGGTAIERAGLVGGHNGGNSYE